MRSLPMFPARLESSCDTLVDRAQAGPRYTSYPPATRFRADFGGFDARVELAGIPSDEPLSLYAHVPFCKQLCWYCGCNTAAANKAQRLGSYLDALYREIALVAAQFPASARVRRIAFGGGSPNALNPVDFIRLFDELTLHFPLEDPVVSIELDPRTLTEEWGPVLGTIGATRASLGVQTFSPTLRVDAGLRVRELRR